jgi:hypothetical protein
MLALTGLCFSCVAPDNDGFPARSSAAIKMAGSIAAGPLLLVWEVRSKGVEIEYPFGQPRLAGAGAIGDDPRVERNAGCMWHGIDGRGWSGGGGEAGRALVSLRSARV